MIFEKDPKVRYVDMAIYIDHHVYSGEFDEELVYQYLYFLIYMLAKKKRYFSSEKSYDDFSIWLATKMYIRLTDPRQFEEDEKLEKITSVLNYIKGILYAKKVEFNQESNFQSTLGKFNSKYIKDFDDDALIDYYRPTVEARNKEIIQQSLIGIFETIPKMFELELRKSPYKNNKSVLNYLYLSCMLTFMDTITIPNRQLEKIEHAMIKHPSVDISKYINNSKTNIILYNVPEYLKDYVKLIYTRVKNRVVDDIKDCISQYSLSTTELTAVVNSNYDTYSQES